jgi:hypothetical protein
VLGARMPEASVDVDRHLRRGEHDVRSSSDNRIGSPIHSVAEPHAMERRAQGELGRSVPLACGLHSTLDVVGRR